jgi:hypothetical protein
MWYQIEMGAWALGIVLQAICFIGRSFYDIDRRPLFWLWVLYDLIFSVILFAINAVDARVAYGIVWTILQPADLLLFGMAVGESLKGEKTSILTAFTIAVGLMLDAHHRLVGASALVCFVASVAMTLRRGDPILMIYAASQCVQHLAVMEHASRWHAGAYSEIATCLCFAAWILGLPRTSSDSLEAQPH